MSLFSDFKQSIFGFVEAYRFVSKHRLGKLLLISFFFYLILAFISGWLIWFGLDFGLDYIFNLKWIQDKITWLHRFDWIVSATKIGMYLSLIFVFLSIYKFIFLAIASPMYAYISERTAEIINQKEFAFDLRQFISDIIRGIFISGVNLLRQLMFTFIMILLSFIPVVGWIFNIIIIFIDAYYYGFSMLDYNCERHKMNISDSRAFISKYKGLAIGNGLVAYFSLLIPIVGIIFIAPLSVISATINFYKLKLHE